jgi:hypothetical protein
MRRQPQLGEQVQRRWLLRKNGVGSRFDGEAVNRIGLDQAAETRRGFEQHERSLSPRQLVRRGKSRDTAAYYCDHVKFQLPTTNYQLPTTNCHLEVGSWKLVVACKLGITSHFGSCPLDLGNYLREARCTCFASS